MYLEAAQIDKSAATLANVFPHHWLYVDLMSRGFARTFAKGMSRVLASIGTAFSSLEPDPLGHLRRLGYSIEAEHPLLPAAIAMTVCPAGRTWTAVRDASGDPQRLSGRHAGEGHNSAERPRLNRGRLRHRQPLPRSHQQQQHDPDVEHIPRQPIGERRTVGAGGVENHP